MIAPVADPAAAERSRGGVFRLCARYIAVEPDVVLAPGLIEWNGAGRIIGLRRARRSEAIQDLAILPGLVNAHAHLQLPLLEQVERRFLPWVALVMAARAKCDPVDHVATARASMWQLLQSGTTAIGEIDSTGHTTGALLHLPMAGRCYRELTGFHLHGAEARALARKSFPASTGSMLPGLSPHAPYSVSADLMQAAAARTRSLAIHCAELPEEQQFLRTGSGPFAELLQRLGRLPADFRAPGMGAVRWLDHLRVLRPSTQLVHCQELERGDVGRIAATGASITVCPGTIDYFRRSPPPVSAWLRKGIPVALGTDSQASNEGLSMRRELARAAAYWPELRPAQLLQMATEAGGRALNGPFGGLRRGRRADFLAVPVRSSWEQTLAAFVHDELDLEQVVLAGHVHRIHPER